MQHDATQCKLPVFEQHAARRSDSEHHLAAGVPAGHLVVRLGGLRQRHAQRHLKPHRATANQVGDLWVGKQQTAGKFRLEKCEEERR